MQSERSERLRELTPAARRRSERLRELPSAGARRKYPWGARKAARRRFVPRGFNKEGSFFVIFIILYIIQYKCLEKKGK